MNEPVDQSGLTSNPQQQQRNKLRPLQENCLTKGKLGHVFQRQSRVMSFVVYSIGSRLNSLTNL